MQHFSSTDLAPAVFPKAFHSPSHTPVGTALHRTGANLGSTVSSKDSVVDDGGAGLEPPTLRTVTASPTVSVYVARAKGPQWVSNLEPQDIGQ